MPLLMSSTSGSAVVWVCVGGRNRHPAPAMVRVRRGTAWAQSTASIYPCIHPSIHLLPSAYIGLQPPHTRSIAIHPPSPTPCNFTNHKAKKPSHQNQRGIPQEEVHDSALTCSATCPPQGHGPGSPQNRKSSLNLLFLTILLLTSSSIFCGKICYFTTLLSDVPAGSPRQERGRSRRRPPFLVPCHSTSEPGVFRV